MSLSVNLSSNYYYDFPEVSALFEGRENVSVSSDLGMEEDDIVCHVVSQDKTTQIPVYGDVSDETCELLYKNGVDSKVGKGKETVLDKNVRRSKEYSKGIFWDQRFVIKVKNIVSELLEKMNAGKLVTLKPYKLIIYGEGDFFSEHMDSTHTPGQNMTCVVELLSECEGDGLIINGGKYGRDKTDQSVIVFDHDLPHEVAIVESGYRVSVTFDLIVDAIPDNSITIPDIKSVVETLTNLGVKRFGFFATQRYMEDQALKGVDARVAKAFEPYVKNTEEINLCTDNLEDWFMETVWDFKNSGTDCGHLMYSLSDEDEEDEKPAIPEMKANYTEWKPKLNIYSIIKNEYCLGDVFLLWSPHKPKHTKKGDEEIHLGNEGFYGDIHENLFVLFTL